MDAKYQKMLDEVSAFAAQAASSANAHALGAAVLRLLETGAVIDRHALADELQLMAKAPPLDRFPMATGEHIQAALALLAVTPASA